MNTKKGSTESDFLIIEKTSVPTKTDDTAAILEKLLQHEKDQRKEERFLWIFAATILIDGIVFPIAGISSIFIFLLQLVFLIGAARSGESNEQFSW